MSNRIIPTKGNLIAIKKQLALAKLGYELLDRKRNIMLREMIVLAGEAADIQESSNAAFEEAYEALIEANFSTGQNNVMEIASILPLRDGLTVRTRSVMGVEIPEVVDSDYQKNIVYGVKRTDSYIDNLYIKFNEARMLAVHQAAIENSVYRLAFAIKQAQKRANALKNIIIPQLAEQVKYIADYLEEKEREQFFSMKMVKNKKQKLKN
ncbi:MAG: V-type ATP synthase subunit D [Eubacteriales bacterium]|nr:V-type ATP synthase subunit D [Eubacteriales bacterium]MDD4475369.1 V-type ATP synthase subunit D [Eubacteriales bacterium]